MAPEFWPRHQLGQKPQREPAAFVISIPARKPLPPSLVFLWSWLILLEREIHEKVPFPLKTESFQQTPPMRQDRPPRLSVAKAGMGQGAACQALLPAECSPPGTRPPCHSRLPRALWMGGGGAKWGGSDEYVRKTNICPRKGREAWKKKTPPGKPGKPQGSNCNGLK